MDRPALVPIRLRIAAGVLMIVLVLAAAAVNVPLALTFMRSRTTITQVQMTHDRGPAAARPWPSRTPHDRAWPAPDSWSEGRAFGCRVYDVRAAPPEPGRNGYAMSVQQVGWPLPVIEEKQMWWDWNDPALTGPESDPRASLLLPGLILNPLLAGGALWAVIVLPLCAFIIGRRWTRRRFNACMECGYPAASASPVCTECGSPLGNHAGRHGPA